MVVGTLTISEQRLDRWGVKKGPYLERTSYLDNKLCLFYYNKLCLFY